MVRLFGASVVALMSASTAAAENYVWIGKDHACIVETSIGLVAGEDKSAKDAAFLWNDAPKGFRLQLTWCDAVPVGQGGWPACSITGHLALRTPNLLGTKHYGWSVNTNNSYAFSSADSFETMVLSDSGRFSYAQFGTTKESSIDAWFTMSGSCTPFDE